MEKLYPGVLKGDKVRIQAKIPSIDLQLLQFILNNIGLVHTLLE